MDEIVCPICKKKEYLYRRIINEKGCFLKEYSCSFCGKDFPVSVSAAEKAEWNG